MPFGSNSLFRWQADNLILFPTIKQILKFPKSYSFANDVTNDNFEPRILPEFYKDEQSFEKRENEITQERNRELGKMFQNEIFLNITFRTGK